MQLDFPLRGLGPVITSPFGQRTSPITGKPSFHEGVDLRAPQGTPIISPAAGTVVFIVDNKMCGHGVIVEHSSDLKTTYCHMSRIDVSKGQRLTKGQQIGLSGGARGTPGAGSSTAPHLHWVVQRKIGDEWKYVDPIPLLNTGGPAWPLISDAWEAAEQFVSSLWTTNPAPAPAPARASAPSPDPTVSIEPPYWSFDASVPTQVRLVSEIGRSFEPGQLPPGRYTVEAFDGSRWVWTGGTLVATNGRRYYISSAGGRLKLDESSG